MTDLRDMLIGPDVASGKWWVFSFGGAVVRFDTLREARRAAGWVLGIAAAGFLAMALAPVLMLWAAA